jgi:hypothetical protein
MPNRFRRTWFRAVVVSLAALSALSGLDTTAAPGNRIAGAPRDTVFEMLVATCGYGTEVRLRRGPVYGAQAVLIDDQQIILYNPRVLDKLDSEAGTSWAAASVIAHELGHHYYGHPHLAHQPVSSELRHRCELAADYFSGYALARLGATLGEAQAAQRLLMTDETDLHPASRLRLDAIEGGWLDASAGHPISASPELRFGRPPSPTRGGESIAAGHGVAAECGPDPR